jgi:anti-sigma-K factor RskA
MRDHDLERDPPPADIHAGEYVLGVLQGEALRDARRRLGRDPAFARLVDDWATRLAPLDEESEAEPAPSHVWPRVRSALGWSPVASADGTAPKLAFWRGAAAAGFSMAAALAVVALVRPAVTPEPASAPQVVDASPAATGMQAMPQLPVTKLVHQDGSPAYLASIDRASGGMWVVPMPGETKAGDRLPVLWLIPEGGTPKVLGFVDVRHSHWVDVPKDLHAALGGGSVLAITLEPAAKAPPQAPSSAPVATGGITL